MDLVILGIAFLTLFAYGCALFAATPWDDGGLFPPGEEDGDE